MDKKGTERFDFPESSGTGIEVIEPVPGSDQQGAVPGQEHADKTRVRQFEMATDGKLFRIEEEDSIVVGRDDQQTVMEQKGMIVRHLWQTVLRSDGQDGAVRIDAVEKTVFGSDPDVIRVVQADAADGIPLDGVG